MFNYPQSLSLYQATPRNLNLQAPYMIKHIKSHHKACNFQLELRKFYHIFSTYERYRAQAKRLEHKIQEHLIHHFLSISSVSLIILITMPKMLYLL